MIFVLFISCLVLAEVSIFEEVSSIQEVKNTFASALETFVSDDSHTPVAFGVVADEFHALDLDNNHILDDAELLLYMTGEARYALETAFPSSEDAEEGFLSFESFKAHARFSEPKSCEEYIAQTDFSSEDLWRELTGVETSRPVRRDSLVMTLAMATKEGVAPGIENNCADLELFPEELKSKWANCAEAKLGGICDESSSYYRFGTTFCEKTCGFCKAESDIPPVEWQIEDFFNFHTSEKFLDAFSGLSQEQELVLVDEMTHETKPEWEENCKAVRRRLTHPCVVTAAIGSIAGAIAGGFIQCHDPQVNADRSDFTYDWKMRCVVRGVLGGAVSGAAIGGFGCLSVLALHRFWTRPFLSNIWDQSFTIVGNGASVYAAASDGWANQQHTTIGNIATWSFQDVSNDQKWYEFGSWTNPFGRRSLNARKQ